MNQIYSQIKRIFSDDGRNDKDFTPQEIKLKQARDGLERSIYELKKSADHLYATLAKLE